MRGLIEWYLNGGPFMWPILIAAVIGIAYILERFITFARAGVDPKKFTENVVKKLKKGGVTKAIARGLHQLSAGRTTRGYIRDRATQALPQERVSRNS